jgi:hypothetical protein
LEECWKPVVGYEDTYEVSNLGRIRSVPRVTKRRFNGGTESNMTYSARILKPMSTRFDYLKYGLSRNGKTVSMLGHRIVAKAWLPNPNDYPIVHHRDHNKHNNSVENLEWSTQSNNIRAAIEAGHHNGGFKRGTKHHSGKFTDEQIRWMFRLKEVGYSYTELLEIFGSNRGYISQVLNGLRRTLKEDKPGFQTFCKPMQVAAVCPQTF